MTRGCRCESGSSQAALSPTSWLCMHASMRTASQPTKPSIPPAAHLVSSSTSASYACMRADITHPSPHCPPGEQLHVRVAKEAAHVSAAERQASDAQREQHRDGHLEVGPLRGVVAGPDGADALGAWGVERGGELVSAGIGLGWVHRQPGGDRWTGMHRWTEWCTVQPCCCCCHGLQQMLGPAALDALALEASALPA